MRERMLAVIQGQEHDRIPFAMYEIMFPPELAFELPGRGNAVAMWPEKRLWLDFSSTVHLAKPAEIRAEADRILAAAGHTGRLQIQISGNVPLNVWRTSFPIIVEAIEAFGMPMGG